MFSEDSFSSERNSRHGDGDNTNHKPSRRKKRKVCQKLFPDNRGEKDDTKILLEKIVYNDFFLLCMIHEYDFTKGSNEMCCTLAVLHVKSVDRN